MLADVPASLVQEWQAYYNVEPWGGFRQDIQTGILASLLANIHRRQHSRAYETIDFMPDFAGEIELARSIREERYLRQFFDNYRKIHGSRTDK